MKHVNRQELIARLMAICEPANPLALLGAEARHQAIAEAIDDATQHATDSETRRVTILLSDLRGFTAIAEKFSAMDMVAALNRYLSRMTEIILRHGGSIDKFMGDAIMVLFGAPHALPNDIEAALACAIEMQMAMDEINAENKLHDMAALYMGIGINTGDVVVGHLGSRLHSEYTVIGDQVNLASRVEAHSLRGQILLSESTYQQARDFIDIGDINDVQVKGKKGNVRMVELLALRGLHPLIAPKREVRNSPRVEVDMPLAYQILKGKSVLPEEHIGRIADLSYGGMFVISPVALAPFDDIKITLSLSLMGRELTEIYAKVLRVTELHGEYKCPVEFTSIETKAAQTIKEFVDSIVEFNKL
ncbi:adenylate/guanylate cyclase domain-containing protein [Rhodoferax sp.]|uniref:adenylate/guanylate cyclase domain-containing protein n=1 Tax=Rhodoferax sp. TaxID=50421 RepID=UPI0025F434F0|nr:adenylate/guanylate cyclase domain-containing protein [Rhodoferax sp.]